MSCNYADGLSPYDNKGVLGIPEKFDPADELDKKCELLAQLINDSKHVVVHTGAGISTSAGIPDFRGPNGVWTLEKEGRKPTTDMSFENAVPTKTHMILKKLVDCNKVHYVVSQNIDGLHLKSGLPRKHLAELHGNMYVDECNDKKAELVINYYVDEVLERVMKILGLEIPPYSEEDNPTKTACAVLDWTVNRGDVKALEKVFQSTRKGLKKKRLSNNTRISKNNNESKQIQLDIKIRTSKKKVVKIM
ncbi:putative chromatin regulatory protein sir2 [Operophtera brumata]|uniref:protein acetyllysine N-acetyltransferase n=1 Tax=Operophtera brumata TaxID=104452 RepID=A0A0L7LUW8_OPEBR|nr:putative chromatin regulatory protein sir2 [Operophtera brumata]